MELTERDNSRSFFVPTRIFARFSGIWNKKGKRMPSGARTLGDLLIFLIGVGILGITSLIIYLLRRNLLTDDNQRQE